MIAHLLLIICPDIKTNRPSMTSTSKRSTMDLLTNQIVGCSGCWVRICDQFTKFTDKMKFWPNKFIKKKNHSCYFLLPQNIAWLFEKLYSNIFQIIESVYEDSFDGLPFIILIIRGVYCVVMVSAALVTSYLLSPASQHGAAENTPRHAIFTLLYS